MAQTSVVRGAVLGGRSGRRRRPTALAVAQRWWSASVGATGCPSDTRSRVLATWLAPVAVAAARVDVVPPPVYVYGWGWRHDGRW